MKQNHNTNWSAKCIRYLWVFSYTVWVERCKHVNKSSKDDPNNLRYHELLYAIRQYLRTERSELSVVEKKIHLNVSRGLRSMHTKTLVKWLQLIAKERQLTIRAKRENRRPRKKVQTLDAFLVRKRPGGEN